MSDAREVLAELRREIEGKYPAKVWLWEGSLAALEALLSEREALRAEVDRARAHADVLADDLAIEGERSERLEEDNARLRGALTELGVHPTGCGWLKGLTCTCGLEAALHPTAPALEHDCVPGDVPCADPNCPARCTCLFDTNRSCPVDHAAVEGPDKLPRNSEPAEVRTEPKCNCHYFDLGHRVKEPGCAAHVCDCPMCFKPTPPPAAPGGAGEVCCCGHSGKEHEGNDHQGHCTAWKCSCACFILPRDPDTLPTLSVARVREAWAKFWVGIRNGQGLEEDDCPGACDSFWSTLGLPADSTEGV